MEKAQTQTQTVYLTPKLAPLWKIWPWLLGLAVIGAPTIQRLARQSWSREVGAHGPLVLCIGFWLLWRKSQASDREPPLPGRTSITLICLFVALVVFVFGRAYDFVTFQTLGVYGVGLCMAYALEGAGFLIVNWFPLLFIGFVVPPPSWILTAVTAPLKELVSMIATSAAELAGLPVARQGVTIMVGSYQLLVEDACSGMNSLIGLSAITILYIYLTRGGAFWYSLVLLAFVAPIAVAANVIRIFILIVLTYFEGDEVAQGFLHYTTGMVLFMTALGLVFLLDKALSRLLKIRRAAV